MGDKERMEGEGGLCVFAETVFGQHVRVRKPRKDHVERLAEERRRELRRVWSCRISIGLRWCIHHMIDGKLTSSRRPPLIRGSAHPSEMSTSFHPLSGGAMKLLCPAKTACTPLSSRMVNAKTLGLRWRVRRRPAAKERRTCIS